MTVEIMSPAGNYESLRAAIKAGANSVYFGATKLNMRAKAANNFTIEDLKEVSKICKEKGVKTYLTVNTILYDEDLTLMREVIDAAKKNGITAVIASDISAIQYAHSSGIEVHISTQTNVSNIEAVKFFSQYADVIVLARELGIEQIKNICGEIKEQGIKGPSGELVRIEIFAHGALCVSISGKCYMSLAQYNKSANRGECLQACRRSYKVIDEETGDELVVDNKYVMSPKDLCTIGFIDRLLDTGVKVLKLEGRGRPPEYVYTVTKIYREAADSYLEGTYTQEKVNLWMKKLESVFNRGFWLGGYYMGKQIGDWSGTYGSKATHTKTFLGIGRNYYAQKKVGEFLIQSGKLNKGDEIIVTGPTTGYVEAKVESMYGDNGPVEVANKGDVVTIPIMEKIRKNDKLYVMRWKDAKNNS